MKVGDLVFRKKCDVLDNLYHISDYCYDSDGTLVNLKDSIGVVISASSTEMPLAVGTEATIEVLIKVFEGADEEDEEFEREAIPEVVWVAWSPEISSLEKVENLKVLEEDDLDPFAKDETDG